METSRAATRAAQYDNTSPIGRRRGGTVGSHGLLVLLGLALRGLDLAAPLGLEVGLGLPRRLANAGRDARRPGRRLLRQRLVARHCPADVGQGLEPDEDVKEAVRRLGE